MKESISTETKRKIMNIVYTAEHSLEDELSIKSLAQQAGMSEKHFQRCFRTIINESPKNYIRRIRLQRAAYSLTWSDAKIIDIAFYSGFDSPGGFSKAFVKAYGCSPQAFRDNQRVAPYIFRPSENSNSKNDQGKLEVRGLTVRIETSPGYRLAAMRHIGPVEKMADVWPLMVNWMRQYQLLNQQSILLGIHNDLWDEDNENRYRYDAAVVVPDDFESDDTVTIINIPAGTVTIINIPAGKVAITEFQGSLKEADQT